MGRLRPCPVLGEFDEFKRMLHSLTWRPLPQLMLLVSIVLVTMSVPHGLGKHVAHVPVESLSALGLMGNFTGTFSILAAVWSKTSFALTLLRLMSGRIRIMLWAIIATINISMGLNAVFMWTRCSPASKVWNPFVPGTCWEPHVYPAYGMFAAGEFVVQIPVEVQAQ